MRDIQACAVLALGVLSAQACKSDAETLPATGITVAIYTDGLAGSDFDRVTLTVSRAGQVKVQREWLTATTSFPNTFSLEPAQGAPLSEPIEVTVQAWQGGAAWTRRDARVAFHEGVNHLLRMPLCRSCATMPCNDPSMTCNRGQCANASVEVSGLPAYGAAGALDDGQCSPAQDAGAETGAGGSAGDGGGTGGNAGSSGDCTPACQSPVPVCVGSTCVQCQFDTHCAPPASPCMKAKCGLDHTCKETPLTGEPCGTGRTCSDQGVCGCEAGLTDCSGGCFDLKQDPSNCGNCGMKCSGATPSCVNGTCSAPLSCSGLPSTCGPTQSDSCCETKLVTGGEAFPMGCHASLETCSGNDGPEHIVKPDSFWMDTYEVTVGRVRKYVESLDKWSSNCTYPPEGAGAHPAIKDSGWHKAYNVAFSCTRSAWESELTKQGNYGCTYTPAAGDNENKPATCMTWHMAFAFCIWDGGRLPTEEEWEYAAAGGSQNRLYPWGNDKPDPTRAIYGYLFNQVDGGVNADITQHIAPVGSRPAGVGRWGQHDLQGNVGEWTRDYYAGDWYANGGASCTTNCLNLGGGINDQLVLRGGAYNATVPNELLRNSMRLGSIRGVRCVRNP